MTNIAIVRKGASTFTFSWPDGYKKSHPPYTKPTDEDVLARALWLERHGRPFEAEELLDVWLITGNLRMVQALSAY